MDKLTEDAVREIEQIHSSWIEFEVAGEEHSLMTLCADDIELLPPDAQPVLGRAAVSAQLAQGNTRIHGIEISNRRIRGSDEIAYLTARYKTTFSLPEDTAKTSRYVACHSRVLVIVGPCGRSRNSSAATELTRDPLSLPRCREPS